MPEGDTIHRVARRFEAALVGKEILAADCAERRSPLHRRASRARRANARVRRGVRQAPAAELLRRPGRPQPSRRERSLVRSRRRSAELRKALAGARRRAGDREPERRQDPADDQRRARPQRSGAAAARPRSAATRLRPGGGHLAPARLRAGGPASARPCSTRRLIAGVGNVIRIEACFLPGVSPWRPVGELTADEAAAIVDANSWVMETSLATGHRPKQIYGRARAPLRAVRRPDHDPWAG